MQTETTDLVATVDLGSNSFHLLVARPVGGDIVVIDRLRERVALGAGLDERGRLTSEARQRALACIGRFGQRLQGICSDNVRAVGTSALRQAKNARHFLVDAEAALGHRIEIISGTEEARLIYLGVAHSLPVSPAKRLAVDIGGGSTECVIGTGFEPLVADSLHMGCVSYSLRFFPEGKIDRQGMERAFNAACLEFESLQQRYATIQWDEAIGASGTVEAVASIVKELGWSTPLIRGAALGKLKRHLIAVGNAERLDLPGMSPDRKHVLAGGVAILAAFFETFQLDEMRPASGALREGLLYDHLGRLRTESGG